MGVDDNPVLHLYDTTVTVDEETTLANVSQYQCSSAGYAPITLVSNNWTTTQTGGGVTTAVYSEQTFVFATLGRAAGYYVTNQENQLLWLEQFSGAMFNIPDGGGTVSITCKLTLT
jgi:hypothetical protein